MKGPFNDPRQDAQLDENDPVWRLLGRASLPEPDAWFAARTLARCRHEGQNGGATVVSLPRLTRMWRWALGGGLGLSLALVLMVAQIHSEKVDNQKNVQEAFEIMASIDPDSDSSSWQDTSL